MKYVTSILALAVLVVLTATVLPATETTGKDIFLNNKCNACHAIKSQEIAGKASFPDLSNVGSDERVNEDFLKKFLHKEAELGGKKHAIKFNKSDEELDVLVKWLLTLKTTK